MNHAPDQQLIEAARSGRLGVVGLLVDAGARIGPFGDFHVTPLRVAMLEAHADVVQYLIAHGALPVASTTRTSVLTEAVSYPI
jgi:ankyrin repeat protein